MIPKVIMFFGSPDWGSGGLQNLPPATSRGGHQPQPQSLPLSQSQPSLSSAGWSGRSPRLVSCDSGGRRGRRSESSSSLETWLVWAPGEWNVISFPIQPVTVVWPRVRTWKWSLGTRLCRFGRRISAKFQEKLEKGRGGFGIKYCATRGLCPP